MKRKNYKILILSIIAILSIIIMPSRVNAGLQANKGGTSLTSVTANNFFKAIRKMETQYGTLGKNANLDNTTYLDSTGNGIDCHMILNTEWGGAGILAYSAYGYKPTGSNDSTTGNASGVYQMGYGNEYVAGIEASTKTNIGVIANADSRYYNKYASKTSIPGDGLGILGNGVNWVYSSRPIFVRSYGGVLGTYYDDGGSYSSLSSRAAVVCGTGL